MSVGSILSTAGSAIGNFAKNNAGGMANIASGLLGGNGQEGGMSLMDMQNQLAAKKAEGQQQLQQKQTEMMNQQQEHMKKMNELSKERSEAQKVKPKTESSQSEESGGDE